MRMQHFGRDGNAVTAKEKRRLHLQDAAREYGNERSRDYANRVAPKGAERVPCSVTDPAPCSNRPRPFPARRVPLCRLLPAPSPKRHHEAWVAPEPLAIAAAAAGTGAGAAQGVHTLNSLYMLTTESSIAAAAYGARRAQLEGGSVRHTCKQCVRARVRACTHS